MFYNVNATNKVNEMIKNAQVVAEKYNNNLISSEHLFYGAMKVDETINQILFNYGVDIDEFENVLKDIENKDKNDTNKLDLTETAKQLFIIAKQLTTQLNTEKVDISHIVFAILLDENCVAVQILENKFDVNLGLLRKDILELMKSNSISNEEKNISEQDDDNDEDNKIQPIQFDEIEDVQYSLPERILEMGIDFTDKAKKTKYEPIIGRDNEIDRLIEILCRKTKNNPVLVGEAGVGKTAVVEGLAQKIVANDVPDELKDKIIYSLDIAGLMSGTKYRGALEEKLKEVISIILSSQKIILFIDEIHTLAQAGTSKGEISPADILKPYLARGEIQTIGATTNDEYRKFIEKDKALERRFQPVQIDAPSEETTVEILKGLKVNFETYHNVKISEEAINSAVYLSVRYITNRNLPDKAIDLIDEASSRAKINASKENEEKPLILGDDIARVVSQTTGIPVSKLTESEKEKLASLEEILHKRLIGQDEAVNAVSKAIRRSRVGLKENSRPIGSFMFLGPTGVGKTELAKALAEVMFDNQNALIRLDMSEYMESHSVSKLIGSPPGYVGFEEGGQLTEKVRKKPYSVIVFDEIEKAHRDILNLLLQVLDDGRLTDSQGRLVNFQNTIIIMTSNAGVSELIRNNNFIHSYSSEDEYEKQKQYLLNALKKKFEPEFLNRIDVITVFKSLTKNQLAYIAKNLILDLRNRLAKKNLNIKLTEKAVQYLLDKGLNPEYGARPLKRIIEQEIEDPIAEALITGDLSNGDTIIIEVFAGKLHLNYKYNNKSV